MRRKKEEKRGRKGLEGIERPFKDPKGPEDLKRRRRRSRRSQLRASSDVLRSIVTGKSSAFWLRQARYYYLWRNWSNLVQDFIAAHSLPVDYKDGTLFLWVVDSTWMQELSFMREEMLACLHRKLGSSSWLHSIRFTRQKKYFFPKKIRKLCFWVDTFLKRVKAIPGAFGRGKGKYVNTQ